MECDRMLANCLTKLQLPFIKETIAVCWQHKANLTHLAPIYAHQVPNIYQLKLRSDLNAEYPPIFDKSDRDQMQYILSGYNRIGGVVI